MLYYCTLMEKKNEKKKQTKKLVNLLTLSSSKMIAILLTLGKSKVALIVHFY